MKRERIALGIRYDGTNYHGWQSQENLLTVQQKVEHALSCVANHTVSVICAGRTDAGVHAAGQVVHFDTEVHREEYSWVFGANSNLPGDVAVLWAKSVDMEFHARYTATARKYRYILYNHPVKPGILRKAVGWYHRPLDVDAMQQASECLIGEHDFSSFRGAYCQSNTAQRNLMELTLDQRGRMIIIEVKANAFLLHMVRNIVGSLLDVGRGYRPVEWMAEVLAAKDRTQAGVTISPQGLYLAKVDYPLEHGLPETPIGPFFLD